MFFTVFSAWLSMEFRCDYFGDDCEEICSAGLLCRGGNSDAHILDNSIDR